MSTWLLKVYMDGVVIAAICKNVRWMLIREVERESAAIYREFSLPKGCFLVCFCMTP